MKNNWTAVTDGSFNILLKPNIKKHNISSIEGFGKVNWKKVINTMLTIYNEKKMKYTNWEKEIEKIEAEFSERPSITDLEDCILRYAARSQFKISPKRFYELKDIIKEIYNRRVKK